MYPPKKELVKDQWLNCREPAKKKNKPRPSTQFEALYQKYEAEGRARKTIKAQELWFAILEAQVETGTPYMLFKNACNAKSNQKNLGTIRSSNLCCEVVEYSSDTETAGSGSSGSSGSGSDEIVRIDTDPYPSTYEPMPSGTTLIRGGTVFDGIGGEIENGISDGHSAARRGRRCGKYTIGQIVDGEVRARRHVHPRLARPHCHPELGKGSLFQGI